MGGHETVGPGAKLPRQTSEPSDYCPFGLLPLRTSDPSDYCPFGLVTLRTSDPSDYCPFGLVNCPPTYRHSYDVCNYTCIASLTYVVVVRREYAVFP